MFWNKKNDKEYIFEAIKEDNLKQLKSCLKHVDIGIRNGAGANLARYSVEFKSMKSLAYVLEQGCSPDIRTKEGRTALSRAADDGNFEAIELLIKYKADINIYDCFGMNALHHAGKKGWLDVVKALVKAGADISAITKSGQTAETIAKDSKQEHVSGYLEKCRIEQSKDVKELYHSVDEILLLEHNKEELEIIEGNDNSLTKHRWVITDDQEITRIADKPAINSRVTEVFNFQSAQIITILSDLKNNDRTFLKEYFNDESCHAIEQATSEYEKETGKKAITVDLITYKHPMKWENRN